MSESLIDPKTWEELKSMTDSAFLVELIDVYLSDSPDLIQRMRTGLVEGNIEVVRRAAHSLKSNSASFGASRLTGAARDLEMLAKSGTLDGGAAMLGTIEAEYARLSPLLMEKKNEC